MAEQIKFGDRLFLAGEKVILDNGTDSPKLEARNGKLVIGYNEEDVQAKNHTVVIRGDLIVEGTTTTVNSEVVTLEDNVIEIGAASDNGQFVYGDPHDVVGVNMHLSETEIVGFKFKRTGAGWSEAPWADYNFDDYASWKLEPIANGDGTDRLILTNLASENFYSVNVDINGGEIDGTDIGLNSSAASVFSTMRSDLVDINGGTVDNTVIGSEVSSSAIFTTMTTDEADINGGSINDTIIGFEVAASAVFTDVIADSISTDRLAANIANIVAANVETLTATQATLGDFTFNQNVMSVVSEQMEIRSPGGISFYPDSDNSNPVPQGGEKIIWLRDGAKLVFEGTIPDDYEVKLQATDITADRDIILPDESGTLALQEWVRRELNYVQFQSIIGDGVTTDYTMHFTVAEDWQALVYIDGVLQEPTTSYTITNGDHLSFAAPIPNTSVVNLIRLANNSNTSSIVSSEDSNKLNSQPGSYYLDYNNFYNIPTNVAAFSNDAFYISVNDGYATEQYVDTRISNLVNSAPATLDTLNELATALGNDPQFSTSVTNLIGTKAAITYVDSEITTAKSEAISTASADATIKADNARSNAISTAAADATSKANTAESNANAYTDNAIANIPAPTGGGYPNFASSENLSHGSAVGGTTVTATIPAGATIAYIPWTTINSARNSGPFNVIVNGTSYFVDDMATGGESGSTPGLLEIGLLTGTIIQNGVVTALLGTPVTSLQLYSQHNDSDRGSASVSATVYYDA